MKRKRTAKRIGQIRVDQRILFEISLKERESERNKLKKEPRRNGTNEAEAMRSGYAKAVGRFFSEK